MTNRYDIDAKFAQAAHEYANATGAVVTVQQNWTKSEQKEKVEKSDALDDVINTVTYMRQESNRRANYGWEGRRAGWRHIPESQLKPSDYVGDIATLTVAVLELAEHLKKVENG